MFSTLDNILDQGRIIVCLMFQYNFEDKKNNKAQEEAYKKTGNQRKIKSEVTFMNNYISRKSSDPLETSRQLENNP